MSKFKVGDKVRVVAMNTGHQFNIGEVVIIDRVYEAYYAATNGKELWYLTDAEIEPITPPRQLEVGGTYTSKNGNKWECIAVKGDVAWLVGVYSDGVTGSAYSFKLDGTPICLKSSSGEYNIIFPPIIEERRIPFYAEGNDVYLTYTVKDGVPDWDTAKVVPCE